MQSERTERNGWWTKRAEPVKSMMKYTSIAAMMTSVCACELNTRARMNENRADCCVHLEPMYLHENDTERTKQAIVDYLITYEALCNPEN